MSFQFDRQPDYENWPEDEFFNAKRSKLESLQWEYDATGTLNERDFRYVMGKNKHFWCLFNHHANERLRIEAELLSKDLEIEDLKRQLEEKSDD